MYEASIVKNEKECFHITSRKSSFAVNVAIRMLRIKATFAVEKKLQRIGKGIKTVHFCFKEHDIFKI